MEQQGRELLHSMRAAEWQQRSHRPADGAPGPPPPAHPAGLPPPEFGGFPKPETTCVDWIKPLAVHWAACAWNASCLLPYLKLVCHRHLIFGSEWLNFVCCLALRSLPAGKTSDDIWRGLGMDMQPSGDGGANWPSASGPASLSDMRQPRVRGFLTLHLRCTTPCSTQLALDRHAVCFHLRRCFC